MEKDLIKLIQEAKNYIEIQEQIGNLIRTPLIKSRKFSNNEIQGYFKLENLQVGGSFKIRGVIFALYKYINDGFTKFITPSTGNHAIALSYASKILNSKAIVVVPEITPLSKIKEIEKYGAEIIKYGKSYIEAEKKAIEIISENKDIKLIHTFNDYYVIAGHTSVILEIIEDLPEVDAFLIPLGGGALPAGAAYFLKMFNPKIKIFGIQPEKAPFYKYSLEQQKPVTIENIKTIADGLASRPGEIPFEYIKKYISEILLVDERTIEKSIYYLLNDEHIVAEGAGAIAIGPFLDGSIKNLNVKKVVSIITGSHIDIKVLNRILNNFINNNSLEFSNLL